MDNKAFAREFLAQSLTKRSTTAEVAQAILALNLPLRSDDTLRHQLESLACEADWMRWAINDDFDRVDPLDDQLGTFRALFPQVNAAAPATELVQRALTALGITGFDSAEHALMARPNLAWNLGEATSKKAFTKRLRFLKNFEEKLARFDDITTLRHAQMQAKSRLAYLVEVDKCDDVALAFIAYLASRANRRSLFMLGGQSKAFDHISDALQELFPEDVAWGQIALVMPTPSVLRKVDAARRGELAGIFHRELMVAAEKLGGLWQHLPKRMRAEMVMVKGVDSSRWNAYAGAFNTLRSAWIAATIASGMDEIFDAYLPGKTPRLMASDLVWWAREIGQELHEDTRMFNILPHPWEVVSGAEILTRSLVLLAAEEQKVDAEASGWVGPRAAVESEMPAAEPASVHGVVIANPAFVKILRKAGVFSGKGFEPVDGMPDLLEKVTIPDGEKPMAVAYPISLSD